MQEQEVNQGKVVNVKVKFIRPEFNNLQEWMENESNVYIGRKGIVFIKNEETEKKMRWPKSNSPFANPFKIGKDGTIEEILKKYESHIINKLNNSPELVNTLLSLKNKNLGCWCAPKPCHGDILIKLIKKYENKCKKCKK